MRRIALLLLLAACGDEPVRFEDPEAQREEFEGQDRYSGGPDNREKTADWYRGDQPANTPSPATPGQLPPEDTHDTDTQTQPGRHE